MESRSDCESLNGGVDGPVCAIIGAKKTKHVVQNNLLPFNLQ